MSIGRANGSSRLRRRDRTGIQRRLQLGLPFTSIATTLMYCTPKGGAGRSTTLYMRGAELAMRAPRAALVDRDRGKPLPRLFDFYPRQLPPTLTTSGGSVHLVSLRLGV